MNVLQVGYANPYSSQKAMAKNNSRPSFGDYFDDWSKACDESDRNAIVNEGRMESEGTISYLREQLKEAKETFQGQLKEFEKESKAKVAAAEKRLSQLQSLFGESGLDLKRITDMMTSNETLTAENVSLKQQLEETAGRLKESLSSLESLKGTLGKNLRQMADSLAHNNIR